MAPFDLHHVPLLLESEYPNHLERYFSLISGLFRGPSVFGTLYGVVQIIFRLEITGI